MKVLLWLFLGQLCLVILPTASSLRFNEIMYDPAGSDSGNEWIELYNDENSSINLSDWTFFEGGVHHQINAFQGSFVLEPGEFAILADDAASFNQSHGFLGSILDTSWSSLSNSGENLSLEDPSQAVIAGTFYDSGFGAAGNGKSLEYYDGWVESVVFNGTPGAANSVLAFINFTSYFNAVTITEIMPDPDGDDNAAKPGGEWVELYNPTPFLLELEGFVLYDSDPSHLLYVTDMNTDGNSSLAPYSYLVVYRDLDSDFTLNNLGFEQVQFAFPNLTVIDSASYSRTEGNFSWSKLDSWGISAPTPGKSNSNVSLGDCDYSVDVSLAAPAFLNGSDVEFSIIAARSYGDPSNLTLERWIEDLFGQRMLSYDALNFSIVNRKTSTLSPNLASDDYRVFANITSISCNDALPENNFDSELLVVREEPRVSASSLRIASVLDLGSDQRARFGQVIRARIQSNRGNSSQSTVKAWVGRGGFRISKISTFSLPEYTSQDLTLPIQIDANCDDDTNDGSYSVYAEGFGLEHSFPLEVRGITDDLCQEVTVQTKQQLPELEISFDSFPETLTEPGTFPIPLTVRNNDDEDHALVIWSYFYRGSKSYSGERQANQKEVLIDAGDEKSIELATPFEVQDPGEYRLRAVYLKDDFSTENSLTRIITFKPEIKSSATTVPAAAVLADIPPQQAKPSVAARQEIVYLSSTEKARDAADLLLIGVLTLLASVLLWRR